MQISWLHLSDLHTGHADQSTHWPTIKHAFFDDVARLHDKIGTISFVIFSGDFVQSGSREQFDCLQERLEELWERLRTLGSDPLLFCVPGNHDIQRGSPSSPEVVLLSQWHSQPSIQDEFLTNSESRYRESIREMFLQYTEWLDRLDETKRIILAAETKGLLPGDCSHVFHENGIRFGVVGLNSTWVQLTGGDYDGKLHVDTRQILSVTAGDPSSWCSRNDFNIIVSHHPESWLHKNSLTEWRSNINPPGRFGIHVFGHMHVPIATSISQSGSVYRNLLQLPSWFGLETFDDGNEQRIHGYVAASLQLESDCLVRAWPRRLYEKHSGARKIEPDTTFELDETESYVLNTSKNGLEASNARVNLPTKFDTSVGESTPRNQLNKAEYYIPRSTAHLNVRSIEQRKLLSAWADGRAAWIISEWGLGTDEFLWAALRKQHRENDPVYKIDFAGKGSGDDLTTAVAEQLGFSFQAFCEALFGMGSATLIVEGVGRALTSEQGEIPAEIQLEELCKVVLDYCPELQIALRARLSPSDVRFPTVVIKAFDEADLKTYVAEHDRGSPHLATSDVASKLYRYTDGVPPRLDLALRELEVVSLPELLRNEVAPPVGKAIVVGSSSSALHRAIDEISQSNDAVLQRAYQLLRALSIFPSGEELPRIKRFDATQPFYTSNALALLERGLIERSSTQLMESGTPDSGRRLIVPRPVRDIVHTNTPFNLMEKMNRQAADMYFGPNWRSGSRKWPTQFKYSDPKCDLGTITNANALVVRLFQTTPVSLELEVDALVGLALALVSALLDGDHFRAACSLCEDILPMIPDREGNQRKQKIVLKYAYSLRMLGLTKEAQDIFAGIDETNLSNAEGIITLRKQFGDVGRKDRERRARRLETRLSLA